MYLFKSKSSLIVTLCFVALLSNACGGWWADSSSRANVPPLPAAAPLEASDAAGDRMTRLLEERVRRDPEDFSAHNKLAGLYLQRLRETGDVAYLELAARAARASLASVPEERNAGGLAALTETEFASHDFTRARDHAVRLTELDPGKSYPYGLLGDALLELGDYEKAADAYRQMERRNDGISYGSETRWARLAFLRGDTAGATRRISNALALALDSPVPPRETVAWCRWQLGEISFANGDYETAERHYRDALTTFPDYLRAHAGIGRARAAQGDIATAIKHYEEVVRRLPEPSFVAMLGDLYKLAGREQDARTQYQLVEQIARLNRANGVLYNRQLALFYADHDTNLDEAYRSAAQEYETRRDIYGADTLAWTALKAGKINEAKAAINEALRLGTKDAMLFYHAGMIARAAGDERAARDYLRRALDLNPQFAPLQAQIARQMLAG